MFTFLTAVCLHIWQVLVYIFGSCLLLFIFWQLFVYIVQLFWYFRCHLTVILGTFCSKLIFPYRIKITKTLTPESKIEKLVKKSGNFHLVKSTFLADLILFVPDWGTFWACSKRSTCTPDFSMNEWKLCCPKKLWKMIIKISNPQFEFWL